MAFFNLLSYRNAYNTVVTLYFLSTRGYYVPFHCVFPVIRGHMDLEILKIECGDAGTHDLRDIIRYTR